MIRKCKLMNSLLRKEKDMYSFIPFEKEGVKACFTTRNLDFSFKNNPYLHRNHSDILKRLKVNNRIGLIEQVHGRRVYIYKPMLKSKVLVKADAIITDNLNTPITIRVADCVGIFIFDKVKRVGSLVHSGWRGTQKKYLLIL